MEAAYILLRVAAVLVALVALGSVAAAIILPRGRLARLRPMSNVAVGAGAAALVFDMQRGGLGASLGGAVLALAAGAVAVLIMMLFRSV